MLPCWLTDSLTSDLDRALHYTLLWGLEGVELRTVGGPGERVPYVNEGKLRRRLEENELPLMAVMPGLFEGETADRVGWLNEIAALRETIDFCRRTDCRIILASAFPAGNDDPAAASITAEALQRAGKAVADAGLVLAVMNEWDGRVRTGTALASLLDEVNLPSVKAAWHPADALRAGESSTDGLAALSGRVAFVRCADGSGRGEAWTAAAFGEGEVGWQETLFALRRSGFDGPLSLNLEIEPKPKQGLNDSSRLIAMIRKAR